MRLILAGILCAASVTAASAQSYGGYYGGGGVDYNPRPYQQQETYTPPHQTYVEPRRYHRQYNQDSYVPPQRNYDSGYTPPSRY